MLVSGLGKIWATHWKERNWQSLNLASVTDLSGGGHGYGYRRGWYPGYGYGLAGVGLGLAAGYALSDAGYYGGYYGYGGCGPYSSYDPYYGTCVSSGYYGYAY